MKTVKTNLKMKFFFFVTILLMSLVCIATLAIGQTSLAPLQKEVNYKQEYGDSTIVDLTRIMKNGKFSVKIHNTDEVLVEVISVTHQKGKEPVIDRTTGFKKGDLLELFITAELVDVYILTTVGVTSLNILTPTSQYPGSFLINGKLDLRYTKNHLLRDLQGTSPDRFKDDANWKWDESLLLN